MSGGYQDISWDQIYAADEHLENWDRTEPAPELVELVEARGWRQGARAIDLGCGTGSDARYLADNGFDVIGVDISEEALAAARARGSSDAEPAVEWMLADACSLPVEDASQDLVVDGSCLHHFTRDQWDDYAREVARVLVPRGVLFVRGVSVKHRSTNVLRREWIEQVFGSGDFRIESMRDFTLGGSGDREAPGLRAVILRA